MQPSASIRKCIGVTKKGAWGGAKLGKYGAKWGQKVAKLGLFGVFVLRPSLKHKEQNL